MDVREKLVELLKTNACPSLFICDQACKYYGYGDCFPDRFADYLIAHGITLQEWISVDDRLPEAGGYVVCIAKRNPFSRFMPMVARIGKNGWVNPITEQYISEVTHWMPLPEPPMSAIMDGDAERRNT